MSVSHDPGVLPTSGGPRQHGTVSSSDRTTDAARLDAIDIPNGPAAAAILATGIGCFAVGIFALAGDASPDLARLFTFYTPTGPLSGVTSSAIIVWLIVWYALSLRWRAKIVALSKVNLVAFILLGLGALLTFPPFMDLLQGK